jgi:hypothetical protein
MRQQPNLCSKPSIFLKDRDQFRSPEIGKRLCPIKTSGKDPVFHGKVSSLACIMGCGCPLAEKYNQVVITFLLSLTLALFRWPGFGLSVAIQSDYRCDERSFLESASPLLVIILLVCGLCLMLAFTGRKTLSLSTEIFDLIRAITVSVLVFVFLTYFSKNTVIRD